MPILHVLDVPFQSVFIGCYNCGTAQSVPLNSLQLGVEKDPNLIALPACSSCGSQEFLNRTFDAAPEALADHRKKVNALAIALRGAGRIHSKHAASVKAETRVPAQVGELVGPVAPILGMPAVSVPSGLKLPS